MPHRVAFLGFSESERHALTACFRLAHERSPSYEAVAALTDAELLVADADHAPAVQLVVATERLGEALFIGAQAPADSAAWLPRPIDALRVMRELDGIVGRLWPGGPARDDRGRHDTILQAMRRRRETAPSAAAAPAAEAGSVPRSARLLDPKPQEETLAHFDTAPSDALTLRDPPTPAEGEAPPLPQSALLPGAEDLVGHEVPPSAGPAAATEDLSARLDLPVLREPALVPDIAAAPEQSAKPPKPPKLPKATLLPKLPRALLVDDSVIATLFLERRLERWQMQTDTASNSQAALALLARHSHDLVFLDVELGEHSELDGLGLCRQIKQTPSSMNALVVMVSAHHSELDRVRGALAGCDAYLGKPLDDAELQRLMLRQGLCSRAEAGTIVN